MDAGPSHISGKARWPNAAEAATSSFGAPMRLPDMKPGAFVAVDFDRLRELQSLVEPVEGLALVERGKFEEWVAALMERGQGEPAREVEKSRQEKMELAKKFLSCFEDERPGQLDYRPVLMALVALDPATSAEERRLFEYGFMPYVFKVYDVNGDNQMQLDEFRQLIKHLQRVTGKSTGREDVDKIAVELMERISNRPDAESFTRDQFMDAVYDNVLKNIDQLLVLPTKQDCFLHSREVTESEMLSLLLEVREEVSLFKRFQPDTAQDKPSLDPGVFLEERAMRYQTMVGAYSTMLRGGQDVSNFSKEVEFLSPVHQLCERFLRRTIGNSSLQWDENSMAVKRNLTVEELMTIVKHTKELLQEEATVVRDVRIPCKVFGDTHGHIEDLYKFFKLHGTPSHLQGDVRYVDYVFIGDFVDRGNYSLEVVLTLFSLKIMYPESIHLLRGNHENPDTNVRYGFFDECHLVFGSQGREIFDEINVTFTYLPLAAVIEDRVFCVHGGIGKSLRHVDQLRALQLPIDVKLGSTNLSEEEQIVIDALWSDPTENGVKGVCPNPLRSTNKNSPIVRYGPDIVEEFLKNNRLEMIIRGHQVPNEGMDVFCSGKLLTVTSTRNYHVNPGNPGTMLLLTWKNRGRDPDRRIRVESRFLGGSWKQSEHRRRELGNSLDLNKSPLRGSSYIYSADEKSDTQFLEEAKLNVEKARELYDEFRGSNPVMTYNCFRDFMLKHEVPDCYVQNYFRAFLGRDTKKTFLMQSNFFCGLACMIPEVEQSYRVGSQCWRRRMQFIFMTYDLKAEKRLGQDIKHMIRHGLRAAGDPYDEEAISRIRHMLFENGSLQFLDFETFKSKMTVAKSRLPGVDHIVRFKPGILAFLVHN